MDEHIKQDATMFLRIQKSIILSLFLFVSITFTVVTKAFSSEERTYNFSWLDPDKEVYVLQNRKYRKAGRLHATLGGGITTSGAFVDSNTIQGRVGFFFREEWGAEFVYAKNSGDENKAAKLLRNEGGAGSVPFRRIIDNYMGGMILWSPFYTKVNAFNKIIYLDWILGLGYAKVEETNNALEFLTGAVNVDPTVESNSGLMWNLGVKFFINDRFSLRTDLTTIHYQAILPSDTNSEKDWNTNYDLAVSLGISF